MKVLYVCRHDYMSNPGGDTIQILSTKSHLESLGTDIGLFHPIAHSKDLLVELMEWCDMVHIFNMLQAHQYKDVLSVAASAGKRIAISPVFWPVEQYERYSHVVPVWKKILAGAGSMIPVGMVRGFFEQHLKSITYNRFYKESLSRLLAGVQMVLLNSNAEWHALKDMFGCTTQYRVVVNGCRYPDKVKTGDLDTRNGFILCVGRIEYRKNQIRLIQAVQPFGLPVVLIGNINQAERHYWKQCIKMADRNGVELIHHVDMPLDELWWYYENASVHVQPSWFETPGLTSLEAAAAGCRIVCTARGSAYEYFGQNAMYCEPDDYLSIRKALASALDPHRNNGSLKTLVREKYTWETAARQTLEAYEAVLGQGD
jgi:glycosyltransferase involved in cell wall biosynthesis